MIFLSSLETNSLFITQISKCLKREKISDEFSNLKQQIY